MKHSSLTTEQIEAFAIRCAQGNNGDAWAEHYTDAQKQHWRIFIRDLETAIEEQWIANAVKDARSDLSDDAQLGVKK